jgi:hypothetical protein
VVAQGGRLWVEGGTPTGARFVLVLPRVHSTASESSRSV